MNKKPPYVKKSDLKFRVNFREEPLYWNFAENKFAEFAN